MHILPVMLAGLNLYDYVFLGQHSLRMLTDAGIPCSYIFINAVSYIMKEVRRYHTIECFSGYTNFIIIPLLHVGFKSFGRCSRSPC